MSWKDWPSWLKGGTILMALGLIMIIFELSIFSGSINYGAKQRIDPSKVVYSNAYMQFSQFLFAPAYIIISPLLIILSSVAPETEKIFWLIIALSRLVYMFVLGAALGLIYGKLLKNKEVKSY